MMQEHDCNRPQGAMGGGGMSDTSNALLYLAVIGGIVLFVVCYVKALAEVKAGRLVVYRDWGDFLKASVWILLVPYGVFSLLFDDGGEWPTRTTSSAHCSSRCSSCRKRPQPN